MTSAIFGIAAGIMIGMTTIYPNAGKIVEVDYTENIYVIDDFGGERWKMEGVEDWTVGDVVAFMVSDNATPETIHDDIILDDTIRYLGY